MSSTDDIQLSLHRGPPEFTEAGSAAEGSTKLRAVPLSITWNTLLKLIVASAPKVAAPNLPLRDLLGSKGNTKRGEREHD